VLIGSVAMLAGSLCMLISAAVAGLAALTLRRWTAACICCLIAVSTLPIVLIARNLVTLATGLTTT
jgi:hypothetical protein